MSILVTGGAGYIGSHTCLELLGAGHEVIVADNLRNSSREAVRRVEALSGRSISFYNIDLCDAAECERLFRENPAIHSVIHFAALKAVGESVAKPLEYYTNNLSCTLALLNAMRAHGVKNLAFSSSATVYGEPKSVPVREDFPTGAQSPYGATKLFIERILADFCQADPTFNAALLRYFNPIGAHPSGRIGEDPAGIPNNLVPYIAQVAAGKLSHVRVYGNNYNTPDGTGVRDYIHVADLARGHAAALDKLASGCGLFICNLGTGCGYSVLQVIDAYSKACGKPIPYEIEPRRPGDAATVYADPARAREALGWQANYGLEEMCAHSWNWQKNNPNGYNVSNSE
jgi:UDP-glucose 4-epimerase